MELVALPSLDVFRAGDLASATFASCVQSGAGGSLPATERPPGGVSPASCCPFCLQANVGNTQHWGHWFSLAPYFSRAASHPLFQLASGAQFFKSAERLRQDWSYGCCNSHGRLNQPAATAKGGRGGRGGRKVT